MWVSLSGMARLMRADRRGPSRSRKNSRYSMMPKLITNWNVSCPMLSACVARNWLTCIAPALSFPAGWGCPPVEARQEVMHRRRQRLHGLLEIGAEIQLPGLDALVEIGAFAHQRTADESDRHDHQQQDQQQGDQRRHVAPAAQARAQPPLQRREDDGEDGAPEHRAVERPQQPGEREGDAGQQKQEDAVVQAGGLAHSRSLLRLAPRETHCTKPVSQRPLAVRSGWARKR